MRGVKNDGPRWYELPTRQPYVWHDPWRNRDRTFRFKGRCVVCERKTWGADDEENDPRGVLGDHAASPLSAEDYGTTGSDVPVCFPCANEEPRYRAACAVAERQWGIKI